MQYILGTRQYCPMVDFSPSLKLDLSCDALIQGIYKYNTNILGNLLLRFFILVARISLSFLCCCGLFERLLSWLPPMSWGVGWAMKGVVDSIGVSVDISLVVVWGEILRLLVVWHLWL